MNVVSRRSKEEDAVGCALRHAGLPNGQSITVNGVEIPRDEIARETQHHPAARPIDAWVEAAQALVIRELLIQEAHNLELAPEPLTDDDGRMETDEEALVRQLVEHEVPLPSPDHEICLRMYNQFKHRFRSPDIFSVRHILIPDSGVDKALRIAARSAAEAVLQKALANPAAFSNLAQQHSACPSKNVGGSLGRISSGQTVTEFEAALIHLPVGRIAEALIETRYGFHVVIVDHRQEGKQLPYEMVQLSIADWLNAKSRHVGLKQYIGMLASKAEIKGIELPSH